MITKKSQISKNSFIYKSVLEILIQKNSQSYFIDELLKVKNKKTRLAMFEAFYEDLKDILNLDEEHILKCIK